MAITDCPICMDTFNEPELLPGCGHTFCHSCIATVVAAAAQGRRPLLCPTCRTSFRGADVKPNYTLRQLLADSAPMGSGAASLHSEPASTALTDGATARSSPVSSPEPSPTASAGVDNQGFMVDEPSAPPMQQEAQESAGVPAPPPAQLGRRTLSRDLGGGANSGEGRNPRAVEALSALGVPAGLGEQIMREDAKIARRIFLLDNSGSTQAPDGHHLVSEGGQLRMENCSRWDEIKHMAVEHADWNAKLGTPCEFMLLNPPSHPERREGVDYACVDTSPGSDREAEQQVSAVQQMLDRSSPGGVTPIADRLEELYQRISREKQELVSLGQCIFFCLVTDGLPTTARSGMSTNEDKQRLVASLRRLTLDLPVHVIIRLVTDDSSVVEYYNSVDEEIELNLEVLDDIKSEAQEIQAKGNGWLVYSPVLHKVREGGTFIKLFDLLDERALAPLEISLLCQLLLRAPGSPTFPREPVQFVEALKQYVAVAPQVYDPLRNAVVPPINVLQASWKMVPLSHNLTLVLRRSWETVNNYRLMCALLVLMMALQAGLMTRS